jgi:hypothetical protein
MSPEDSHICRRNEKKRSPSPADSHIGLLINVRVRWTRIPLRFIISINVQVRWT